eukprot:CAMPEP_0197559466 /NCGR_PEP_ID=MMETSP1320-20131121/21301_1 /TAXON_ID=91990 /ORGANISM="Bolidomonas sp., Strain RCC2347" /LENGTH=107 /DNA_ID=CAMNT_0043120905 /DNA_START=63 /DNA_END=383 /DNA_ORIENTATION=+
MVVPPLRLLLHPDGEPLVQPDFDFLPDIVPPLFLVGGEYVVLFAVLSGLEEIPLEVVRRRGGVEESPDERPVDRKEEGRVRASQPPAAHVHHQRDVLPGHLPLRPLV